MLQRLVIRFDLHEAEPSLFITQGAIEKFKQIVFSQRLQLKNLRTRNQR